MESKKLEALLMAVDLGSFTKAAEVLGYTQSGLTHMMNSLEKEVGFTLLERGRSGVRLTEEGERIAPAVREFLQANARLDSVIEQVASSRTEIIRVSAYASIAMHWLPGIIQRFREECPDVDVDIRMADHVDVPYELLAQGKMDAILVSPQDEGQYEWVHLADDPMFAVLPRDFDTQGMTAFPLAAFEARDFIMPSQGFDKDIMRIFNRIGVKPHILPTWVDDPTVISMVSHGLGVSMMTELTVRGRTDGVKLLPVEPASSRELGLAVRSLDAASDGLRHFIDCTKRVVAEMQPCAVAKATCNHRRSGYNKEARRPAGAEKTTRKKRNTLCSPLLLSRSGTLPACAATIKAVNTSSANTLPSSSSCGAATCTPRGRRARAA